MIRQSEKKEGRASTWSYSFAAVAQPSPILPLDCPLLPWFMSPLITISSYSCLMSPLTLALGGRKDKYTGKKRGERDVQMPPWTVIQSWLFIYRDHWQGVGKGLSSPLDCYVCFYVQCCGFYLCTLQENSQQVLKRRSIFRVYYVRYHQNANVK